MFSYVNFSVGKVVIMREIVSAVSCTTLELDTVSVVRAADLIGQAWLQTRFGMSWHVREKKMFLSQFVHCRKELTQFKSMTNVFGLPRLQCQTIVSKVLYRICTNINIHYSPCKKYDKLVGAWIAEWYHTWLSTLEHCAMPWAMSLSLCDDKLFFGPNHTIYAFFIILFGLFDLILLFVCQICHVNCETEN